LATLSTVFASQILGDLFQPPTLLGFALQSFVSSPEIEEFLSNPSFRSDVCLRNLMGLVSTFQRLALPKEAVPLDAPQRFRLGRDLVLS
jgi:hypothetical protein